MTRSVSLQTALDAAAAAAGIITRFYEAGASVQIKGDGSPVTEADMEAERCIRARLLAAFPDDGFVGEESGNAQSRSGRTWIVDPIDGTRSFVRGYPFFSTQIALMIDGELHLGVSSAPWMGELAWAERGHGAWLDGQPLRVSGVDKLEDATLSVGNVGSMARDRRWAGLGRLASTVARFRGYGDFYHYHLLAAGKLDVVLESDINIYDVAALAVITSEAGGQVTDLAGGPLTLDSTSILASNGRLHAPVGEALAGG
jgi:histidinol-phosphatase